MSSTAAQVFTAGQIADALGCTPQAVRQRLEGIPGETRIVQGGPALAWSIPALPAPLQTDLEAKADARGYRNPLQMLARADAAWQPNIPLAEIAPVWIERAVKLKAALAPALTRLDDPAPNRAESEKLALDEYRRQFGHAISSRHWRRLFHRTLERDAGARAWHRIELYLDDAARRPAAASRASVAARAVHKPLDDIFAPLECLQHPTEDDRAFLFHEAFTHFETLLADARDKPARRLLKTSLIDCLFSAVPGLSKSVKSLRRVFEIKLRAWRHGGRNREAVRDARSMRSGKFRRPDFTADQNKIRDLAILHGGNESLAYRKLRQAGELSTEFVEHYHFDPRRNKSYVPGTVRAAITPEVDMCAAIHRGPWQAKMRGPYIPREWSGVAPADWFSGDDITFNSYFYHYDDAGELHIERGECLVLIDLRTGYILDYVLIAGKYNARHIRKLILRVHDKHGLPRKGFYFERGIWEARMIEELDSKHSLHWRETECGLQEPGIGLTVRHATTPRAKTIECLIRIWQERQRNELGFVGFNERTQEMERMQEKIARARRHKLDPASFLLTMEKWGGRLDATFEEFNSDPQNGKMLAGASPFEAWRAGVENNPLRKLPDNARYLLASHCKRLTVRQEGIVLSIGGERLLYANEQTGALIGREVLAYYHVDYPNLLTVSDLNRQNYFTVKRLLQPAMSASKEQLAEAHKAIAGHRQAAKVIYGAIRHPLISTIIRDNEQDPETAALGEFHNRELADFETEQSATTRKLRKVQRTAAAAGIAAPRNIRNPDRVQEGLDREREIMERIACIQQPAAPASCSVEPLAQAGRIPALAPAPCSVEPLAQDDSPPAPGSLVIIEGQKTYILDASSAAGAAASTPAKYWALWKQVERCKPGLSRHALTQKAIGHHPKPQDMTSAELQKMIDVFTAILRDAKQPAPQTP
jgi:hypothetical protein